MGNQGKITIRDKIFVSSDHQFQIDGDVLVRFHNRGQHYALIDQKHIIVPGEAYIEGDLNGPGILHTYRVEFVTNPSPPTADGIVVLTGNKLITRIFKRIP